jgi:hypothetical protein
MRLRDLRVSPTPGLLDWLAGVAGRDGIRLTLGEHRGRSAEVFSENLARRRVGAPPPEAVGALEG